MNLTSKQQERLEHFMNGLRRRNPAEFDFHQAVYEVVSTLIPFVEANTKYEQANLLERMKEPDRVVIFRVCWEDDEGNIRTNRGYRIQFNNAIGPYKGGIRFHPTVNLGILKFLAYEQVFKNSLTTLPMGGAKGGSDFNPKGKSDREVMRFCQAFMTELSNYVGKDQDVPAGDIGVGAREIGYMYGQHKRLTHKFTGVLTGKGLSYGGSLIRTEATGYGCVYFVQNMLQHRGGSIEGKTVVISGSGNVAQYAAEKCIHMKAKVVTLSDSDGFIYIPDGITQAQLDWIKDLKNNKRGRISEATKEFKCEYFDNKKPWGVKCDIALPCATQNEIEKEDAESLVKNGCIAVGEGANMPSNLDAINIFLNAKILYAPGKAANAGGVSVSGLEMAQNSLRISWSAKEVDQKLQEIMDRIHEKCVEYGTEGDYVNYVKGSNIAGFVKVADAMLSYGIL